MKYVFIIAALTVLSLFACELPGPGPGPSPTPSPSPSPVASPSPSASPNPSPSPSASPSPSPSPIHKDQAPYLSTWSLGRPNSSTKPAKDVCRGYKEKPDGSIECNKDSTCLYASRDPEHRWPDCATSGAPSCDVGHWSEDACTYTMCSAGQPGELPREWCEQASPNGPEYTVTGGSCLKAWEHEPGAWDVTIVAFKGCLVDVKACPPEVFKTPDGVVVPKIGSGCGEVFIQF